MCNLSSKLTIFSKVPAWIWSEIFADCLIEKVRVVKWIIITNARYPGIFWKRRYIILTLSPLDHVCKLDSALYVNPSIFIYVISTALNCNSMIIWSNFKICWSVYMPDWRVSGSVSLKRELCSNTTEYQITRMPEGLKIGTCTVSIRVITYLVLRFEKFWNTSEFLNALHSSLLCNAIEFYISNWIPNVLYLDS